MNEPSPTPHPAALPVETLLAQCEVRRQRRSGPGGQHRNKVETAVVLVHRPSGIRAEASERRSQDLNHQMALLRLRVKLAISLRSQPLPAAESLPSELWRSRVCSGRLSVSSGHADFPALLAEALDVLAARDFDMPTAAAHLGATATQLLKLLKQEPEAFMLLNDERTSRNLRPLR